MNGYTLFLSVFPEKFNGKPHSRRLYLSELGLALTKPLIDERNAVAMRILQPCARGQGRGRPVERQAPKRGRCHMCERQMDRKWPTKCAQCFKFVCKDHSQLSSVCAECL